METGCISGYLGDEVYERLSSQLLDPRCVEAGQIVSLSFPLCFAGAIKCPVLYNTHHHNKTIRGPASSPQCVEGSWDVLLNNFHKTLHC